MLFKLEKDTPILESNPQYSIFEEFQLCSDRDLRYISLCYDYDSPLRNLPFKEKKEYAADMAGFLREKNGQLDKNARNTVNGKLEKINKAIEVYKKLQYDQEKDLLDALSIQIGQIIDLMKQVDKKEGDWDMIKKLSPELPKWISQKKELEVLIGYREKDEADDLEGEPLSSLDMFHEGRI